MGRKIPIQYEQDEDTTSRGDNEDMTDKDKTKPNSEAPEAESKAEETKEPGASGNAQEDNTSAEDVEKAADAYAKSAADAYAKVTGQQNAASAKEAPQPAEAGEPNDYVPGEDIPDYETPEYCERPAQTDADAELPKDSSKLKGFFKNKDAKINELQAKSCEYLDSLQRLKAEFENFRKRSRREKADTVKYANEKLLLQLLPVLDNLKRGGAFAEKSSGGDDEIVKGIQMVLRQLEDLLAEYGVECFESEGMEFDPNLHESLYAVEKEDVAPNTVIQEIEPGYMFNEKVLRVAKVAVSREA